ncbi:MAG TPA: ferritin-like domain-containing protein [Flavisolibacter sp.]|nr:ferritin-like domain-containing protein [Flavisolibacter sp.]
MNLQNILTQLEKVDPEVYDRLDTRRSAMQRFATIGKVAAAAALPFAFGSMFKKAYGQTPADVLDVLAFALTLEYLESEFYIQAVSSAAAASAPAADRAALMVIRDHEAAHVAFLRAAITASGGTPVTMTAASFDFSGGSAAGGTPGAGPFAAAFTAYPVLLAVAQTFEDTGVRAYKGQAGRLINNNDVLTAALQIHSVEARHAAKIRYMRRMLAPTNLVPAGTTLQPWITLAQSGIATGNAGADAAIQKSYAGEEVVTQATVGITAINGQAVAANEASEAFDEPLTKAQILDIVDPFIR